MSIDAIILCGTDNVATAVQDLKEGQRHARGLIENYSKFYYKKISPMGTNSPCVMSSAARTF